MTTTVPGRPLVRARTLTPAVLHATWLAVGLAVAFLVPLLLAPALPRDVYYGAYALAVGLLVSGWIRTTGLSARALVARRWRTGLLLGLAFAGVLALVVLREPATARPGGPELAGQILWRGVVYGATDGVLLSVFPILAVFAALGARTLRRKLAVGALALAVSLLFTVVYHAGYPDFRGEKLAKPVAGDVMWSAPTLLTLSPLGAPVAHVALHVSAVLHSSETDVFLPPH